jgi:hypothetical protein
VTRPLLLATALALLVLAGCGGDEERQAARPKPAPAPTETTKSAPSSPTGTGTTRTEQVPTAIETSPEEQPGGAGDEEAARTPVLLTGGSGRVTPRVIHVQPFIAIRVQLRSADGAAYEVRFGRRVVRARPGRRTATADFVGLHAGRSLVGEGPEGPVRIVADARPGP